MLFLMNDSVLLLDLAALTPPVDAGRFASLPLAAVLKLGAEMFAQAPLMAELYAQELRTQLTPVVADNRVWRRMAA